MTEAYRDALDAVVPQLLEILDTFFADQLNGFPHLFDAVVLDFVRHLGRAVAERVAEALGEASVGAARAEGYRNQRSPKISFDTVFGEVTVRSPYMQAAGTSRGVRPVNERLRVHDGARTVRLERAMCDFAVDGSYECAAEKLKEHYGLNINRTTFLRTAEKHGAKLVVDSRMAALEARCDRPRVEEPAADRYLVEMDGSCVRTGQVVRDPESPGPRTPKRGLPVGKRATEWRDLRLAFVRRLDGGDPAFVGGIADFDTIVSWLVAEATAMGWTLPTFTLRVTDGGNGLREALDERFPVGQHVLDKPHLVHQLHEAATEMLPSERVAPQVSTWTKRLSAGEVRQVCAELRAIEGEGQERAERLASYLERFADAMNYDELVRLGLPIGSGEIESAHKSQVQRRLKLPGTWWTVPGANKLLALRLCRTNKRWDRYWEAAA